MTLADRCDHVMALIDDVLGTEGATTAGVISADDALTDPIATSDSSQGR